jgi:uncharacterized protein
MPTRLPDSFDPQRLARVGSVLEGRLAAGKMPRLAGLIEGAEFAEVTLRFTLLEDSLPCIEGEARLTGWVQCQRCLEPVEVVVVAPIRLVVRRPDIGGEREHGEDGAYEVLEPDEERMALASLVEDELLLALPDYPAHERCVAVAAPPSEDSEDEESASPFAVLRDLKPG